MQSLLERIKAGNLWDFHGGIHPADNKLQSSQSPVVDAGLPPRLIIPLRQHAGPAGDLLVQVGDKVKKGQPLTRYAKGRTVPVHASTSGTITEIGNHTVAHPSGLGDLCVILTPDGEDAWGERNGKADYWNLERGELLERIQQAGVAGLGGAVFPTHSKLDGRGQLTEILIVNGLECEPYISTDDRLMQQYSGEIMDGIRVLKHLLKPKLTLIGVEDNKPESIEQLTRHATDEDVLVKTVPTKYPSGGAKQTIELLTGRQVPKGGRAVDIGIMVLNVATVFAIKRAIIDGEPLIERIVTLTGDSFKKPGNAWVRLGTPVRWLLQRFELQPEAEQRVIMGGPMMGFTLPHAMVPVVKATNCLLAPTQAELPAPGPEQACIRCSACADACPATLLPQELYWYSRAKEYDKAEKLNLMDCIECGACAWVCPSEIPLVQYYKIAKDDIREARAEAEKAERAKQRFEAKQARFEREKAAREARHAEAAAQRRQTMTAAGGEDPVAAALARIKAKQDAPITAIAASAEGLPDNSAVITAREARKREAEARRAAKLAESANSETAAAEAVDPASDPKKAAIAAALARAKAKKAAQAGDNAEPAAAETAAAPAVDADPKKAEADPKKAAIAAAIARAKAKKAEVSGEPVSAANSAAADAGTQSDAPADPKKAAIAAAIARAKAKKAEASGEPVSADNNVAADADTQSDAKSAASEAVDPKKAAIAAAIARAKAKKLAQQGESAGAENAQSEPTASAETRDVAVAKSEVTTSQNDTAASEAVDPKKAAIAAAIARAKAKKLAQQGESASAEVESAGTEVDSAEGERAPAQSEQTDTASSEQPLAVAAAPEASAPAADAPVDPKKAAIAAAVARAKAKKLAAEAASAAETAAEDAPSADPNNHKVTDRLMFNIATAPFAHNRKQTRTLMLLVILACVPGLLAQTWFFGWGTFIQILLALVTALLCEALVLKLRGRAIKPALMDGSAALTAVLIGLSLPPLLPWWMLVVGTAFAIIVAKHLYGGLGQNLFNPAMVAYVLLLVSFPVQMTSWLPPESVRAYSLGFGDAASVIFTGFSLDGYSMAQLKQGVDGLTMATPLDTLKTGLTQGLTTGEILSGPLFEGWGGIGWSWVNLGYLLGGLFLLQQKVINWRIPTAILGALLAASTIGYLVSPDATATPIFHLFSGATMLGAFFIATDPVSACTTPRGRLVYGVLIGVLVYIIRRFGGYPDAFAFAVLLANLCVPFIDSLTRPKVYGARRQ